MKRVLLVLAICLLAPTAGLADEAPDRDEILIPPAQPAAPEPAAVVVTEEEVVAAAPSPFIELRRRSLGLGVGIQWGQGVLLFEGREIPISMQGASVGNLGFGWGDVEGEVGNLDDPSALAGLYVAAEAGGSLAEGASVLRLVNDRGVTLTLRARDHGAHLAFAAGGVRLELE